MRILWDFRLFSYEYGGRGVGVFTARMAQAILNAGCAEEIIVWAQPEKVPEELRNAPVQWLGYTPRSWKRDLIEIPAIVARHRIDIFHYWIAGGPIFQIGMGLFHGCKTCCTIHDCGVAFWDDVVQCLQVRKTAYWKFQKVLIGRSHCVVCNSSATLHDADRAYRLKTRNKTVVYTPMPQPHAFGERNGEKRFMTLSGAAHKNTRAIITAFGLFRNTHPEFTLTIFGDDEDRAGCHGPGIRLESMAGYRQGLARSWGLLFCSLHEGLGLPPLEAMTYGCPLLLSDRAPLHETCDSAGIFVDPRDVQSIVHGIEELAGNQTLWRQRSREGEARYRAMSKNAGEQWINIYKTLGRA
jgi:glycosyltransferase involved in cell wall biosynthesis